MGIAKGNTKKNALGTQWESLSKGKHQKVQCGRKNRTFERNSFYSWKLFQGELKDELYWKINFFLGQNK